MPAFHPYFQNKVITIPSGLNEVIQAEVPGTCGIKEETLAFLHFFMLLSICVYTQSALENAIFK